MVSLKVHVYVNKEKITMSIQSEPSQLLENIFEKIARKRGLIRKTGLYKFLEYRTMVEYEENAKTILKYKDYLNLKTLGMKMRIGDLKVSEIVLLERYFADIPETLPRIIKCSTPPTESESPHLQKEQQAEWEAQLASDVRDLSSFEPFNCTSCEYREYDVTRVSDNGRRRERVLGIDRYDIYNQKHKNSNTFMNGIKSSVIINVVVLPPRFKRNTSSIRLVIPMRDVVNVEYTSEDRRKFKLYHAESGQQKSIEYETMTEDTAYQIVTKIKYFMFLYKQENKTIIWYTNEESD